MGWERKRQNWNRYYLFGKKYVSDKEAQDFASWAVMEEVPESGEYVSKTDVLYAFLNWQAYNQFNESQDHEGREKKNDLRHA